MGYVTEDSILTELSFSDRFVRRWVYVIVIHHGKEKIVQYMI
jgi:hypothetical protein